MTVGPSGWRNTKVPEDMVEYSCDICGRVFFVYHPSDLFPNPPTNCPYCKEEK